MSRIQLSFPVAALLVTPLASAGIAGEVQRGRVEAYASDYWTWSDTRSGWVVIEMEGDGDTDLDLFVYDDRGNLVASDARYEDYARVRFAVRAGELYHLEVRNLGDVWNAYYIDVDLR